MSKAKKKGPEFDPPKGLPSFVPPNRLGDFVRPNWFDQLEVCPAKSHPDRGMLSLDFPRLYSPTARKLGFIFGTGGQKELREAEMLNRYLRASGRVLQLLELIGSSSLQHVPLDVAMIALEVRRILNMPTSEKPKPEIVTEGLADRVAALERGVYSLLTGDGDAILAIKGDDDAGTAPQVDGTPT